MKRSTVEERKAYCKEHGHLWVAQYSQKRCSWCGEFGQLDPDCPEGYYWNGRQCLKKEQPGQGERR